MWREWLSFDGELGCDALNEAYAAEIGEEGAKYVQDEAEYEKAVKDGWIVIEGGRTIIMEDGAYY